MAILNNIKNVLSEKGVMSKWLAKQLQKDPATVSKWCNNHSQCFTIFKHVNKVYEQ